ncbi:hypothetical protein AB0I51_03930 [Streptomyces sp. NPDC050549]|uniref:hypothetical protein n=1 Tax=Streptomyces sp. NPDC050549 TaxID=3155406 RepID=UPI0034154914
MRKKIQERVAAKSPRGRFAVPDDVAAVIAYLSSPESRHADDLGLIRCPALDHGRQGVRATAVCPGFVETPMADRIFEGCSTCLTAVPPGHVEAGQGG